MKELPPISNARRNVLALIDHDQPAMRAVLIAGALRHDQNLKHLGVQTGHVAILCDHPRLPLIAIYGLCVGWLMNLGVKRCQNLISAERDRQDELFHTGKLPFNCNSRVVDPLRKLRVLVEEVGEVAEAIDMLETYGEKKQRIDHLIEELVQVAAVCVAWLESLETSSQMTRISADKKNLRPSAQSAGGAA